jgi:hypothetical protein
MSEREELEILEEKQPYGGVARDLLPSRTEPGTEARSSGSRSQLLVPFLMAAEFRAEPIDEPIPAPPASSRRSRLAWAGPVAAAAVLLGGAFWAFNDHRSQAGMIAEQAHQAKALAKTIDALNARLSVIESARPHDELIELRRSVGEIRSNVASSRDLSGALAQLAQRVEKLDRDENAKVDKLNERVDRETSAQAAELAVRIDKLEKKVVASASPAPANPLSPTQKQSPVAPKVGPNVSMETTGSINRPRPVLRGYIVLGARDDVAVVEGRYGERAVRPGDFLPGAGRVEGIARAGGSWVVLTEQGRIVGPDELY